MLGTEALMESTLLQRLFRWSKDVDIESKFSQTTGLIVREGLEKPAAAKQYFKLAVGANLMVRITGMYRNTRLGLVLANLLRNSKKELGEISTEEKLLYAYAFLNSDTDILCTILTQLIENPGLTISEYQDKFQARHIKIINDRIEIVSNPNVQQTLLERRKRIENIWIHPTRYVEHLVPPRLNWLIDLGLVETSTKKSVNAKSTYSLAEPGKIFTKIVLRSQQKEPNIFPDKWIEEDFFSACQESCWPLKTNFLEYHLDSDKKEMLSNVFNEACMAYKNTLLSRIPLEPVLLHSAITLYARHGYSVDLSRLIDLLQQDLSNEDKDHAARYLVRKLARQHESYVVRL